MECQQVFFRCSSDLTKCFLNTLRDQLTELAGKWGPLHEDTLPAAMLVYQGVLGKHF